MRLGVACIVVWARCLQLLDSRTHTCPLSLVHPIFQADKNLKDWILFRSSSRLLECIDTFRDNTGTKEYIENQIFPTTRFPSDHALVSSVSCPCFFFLSMMSCFAQDRMRAHATLHNRCFAHHCLSKSNWRIDLLLKGHLRSIISQRVPPFVSLQILHSSQIQS